MKRDNPECLLMSGNEAIAEAAIRAGCRFYAGYPITPQNEITSYMAKRMPQVGGIFIQAESELAAINMVLGASSTGTRAMTSSSSPGISLKQEGISYIAGCELPAVIINIMRGGPGLGNIAPSQSDYFQATRGGGHGDYHCIVLAPSYVTEAAYLTQLAFNLSDRYRIPSIILGDGLLGQMMEPLKLKDYFKKNSFPKKSWILTGAKNRDPRVIKSFFMAEGELERHNLKLQKKYKDIQVHQQRWEEFFLEKDTSLLLVAYGTMARPIKALIKDLRGKGLPLGMIRPISLWPFPKKAFRKLKTFPQLKNILVVEMSYGQMLEDVRLSVEGRWPVGFLGRAGGGVPTQKEILREIRKFL